MKIKHSARALAQLDAMYAYIAMENPHVADKIIAEIRASINLLADFPLLERASNEKNVHRLVLGSHPYIVFYSIGQKGIVYIVRVLHGKQNYS